jgi:hypothetical protein
LTTRTNDQGASIIFDDAHTRTLLAVCHQTAPTCRSVAAETGCAISTAYQRLTTLRDAGLIAWQPRTAGTMRPTVALPLVLVGHGAGQGVVATTLDPTYEVVPAQRELPGTRHVCPAVARRPPTATSRTSGYRIMNCGPR